MPTHMNRQNGSSEQVVDDTLQDLAIIEESLAYEVAALGSIHAPEKENENYACDGGKALRWWRFKLLTWIHTREACSDGADDLLGGLRLSLKQWDDAELLRFLKQLGRMGACSQQQQRGRSA